MGSKTLTFIPKRPPTDLLQRNIKISAESGAASTLLIFQAILPFLVFAGNGDNQPIALEISGGTNVSFSLSYEYLDQVLLPTLEERFGIRAERELRTRAWSLGSSGRGTIAMKIHPLAPGNSLQYRPHTLYTYPYSYEVTDVSVSIITPVDSHDKLQEQLEKNLNEMFPDATVEFKILEDSRNVARWYVLLVAISRDGIRWGKDILTSMPKKTRDSNAFATQVSRKVCKDLYNEVAVAGQVDEHLQDQIVCFQALSSGPPSSLPRGEHPSDAPTAGMSEDDILRNSSSSLRLRRDRVGEPFGHGSLHTQTVRWVVTELLPEVKFFNKGNVVEGVGFMIQEPDVSEQ